MADWRTVVLRRVRSWRPVTLLTVGPRGRVRADGRRPHPYEVLARRPYRHAPRVPGPLVLPGGGVGAAGSILLGRWRRRGDRPGPVGDDADPVALAVAGEVALDIEARS